MAKVDADLRGQLLGSRYLVEQCVGRGGMGVVWRVRHAQTRQPFALKTIRDSMPQSKKVIRRLLHEARATAAVRSRHVVRVVDVEPDYMHEGVHLPYIVMELLEGENLSQFLDRVGPIGRAELVWIMRQVSQALAAAHARGIVHRDLKPSNVLLAPEDDGTVVVKVCDFGIAKLQGAAIADLAETGTFSTATGEILGTPRYMAPEQLRRAASEGPATDQWAFALIAFRALTGRNYFESASNVAELVLAIVHESLPIPSKLSTQFPDSLDAWFARSCARDPGARFLNIKEQQAELERCLGSEPPAAIRVKDLRPPPAVGERLGTCPSDKPDNAVMLARAAEAQHRSVQRLAFYVGLGGAAVFALAGARWVAERLVEQTSASTERRAHDLGRIDAARFAAPVISLDHVVPAVPITAPSTSLATSSAPNQTTRAKPPMASRGRSQKRPRPVQLPHGSSCTRSAQCESGMCAAEICQ